MFGGLLLLLQVGRVHHLSRRHPLTGFGLRVLHLSRRHLLVGFGLSVQPVFSWLLLLLQLGRVLHLSRWHLLVSVSLSVLHLRRRHLLIDFGLSVQPVFSGDVLRDAGSRLSKRMYQLSAGPLLRGWLVGPQHVRGGHFWRGKWAQ